jgi:COG (conserved oligomeric Golgi) complex component, COG2
MSSAGSSLGLARDFQSPEFDAALFLERAQAEAPLKQIHAELEGHLVSLKKKLYELINRDYADFILVSTKLSGIESKVADLTTPIETLLSEVHALRLVLADELTAYNARLAERAEISDAKRGLRRSLRFLSSLENAERLLAIGEEGTAAAEDAAVATRESRDSSRAQHERSASSHSEHAAAADDDAYWEGLIEADDSCDSAAALSPLQCSHLETCAALERASHYALMLNADLELAAAAASSTAVSSSDAPATTTTATTTTQLLRSMSVRAARVEAEVARRLRAVFSEIVSGQHNARSDEALASCLRSFAALGCGAEAEKQFARVVIQPFLEGALVNSFYTRLVVNSIDLIVRAIVLRMLITELHSIHHQIVD